MVKVKSVASIRVQSVPLVKVVLVTSRANPQIWRMAEWLHTNSLTKIYEWDQVGKPFKNAQYDKAAILLKKIDNREFVGPDNHKD